MDYGCQTFAGRVIAVEEDPPAPAAVSGPTRFDVIDVAGRITADTAWNADTVRVVGDVVVLNGVTLTVEPGVRVEFQDYHRLAVDGTLLAVGTPEQRILFTTDEPENFAPDDSQTGCWNGIRFENTRSTNAPSRLEYCTFEYSKATAPGDGPYPYAGGALSVVGFSDLTVENCIFRNNAADYGGALFLYRNANVSIRGNLFVDNHALEDVSTIYTAYSFPRITNNTIVRNTIQNADLPFYDTAGMLNFVAKPEFTNNILRDNDPAVVYQHVQLLGGKAFYTRFNNAEGYGTTGGNIDADPLFVDPDGPDDLPGSPDDDFRLQAASPCVDAGLNEVLPTEAIRDLQGAARTVDGDDDGVAVVDMGAHEFPHGNVLAFAEDGATLTWPTIGGAQAYNVYRGDIFDLVDGNGDGLPDDGYGDCMNHLDPDTSDTSFLDAAIPDPGTGFFYLMSVVDALGEESFLGTTSAGQPREVLVACPR